MGQRLRHRLLGPLPAATVLLLATGLSACSALPAEVPDDAVLRSGTTEPIDDVAEPTGTPADVAGDEMTRLITLCLARYGLAARPSLPDAAVAEEERLAVEQLQAEYDATLTDCSAEAIAVSASASPTPAS